jgi:Ca2+-binding RTX toxin-like protein
VGLGLALCASLALAGPAEGGQIGGAPPFTFAFNASAGETNAIVISNSSAGRFLLDDVYDIVLGSGAEACTYPNAPDNSVVSCPLSGTFNVIVEELDDGITVANDVPMTFYLRGDQGADTIDGGGLADEIDGGDGNDVLRGDAGDDEVRGDLGADNLDGGAGTDLLDYDDERTGGVTVNLTTNVAPDGDTFANFENLQGTLFDDHLTGNASDNLIRGQPGADTLNDGGGGNDTVSYAGNAQGVVVNLVANTNSEGDTLVGQWEGAIGSAQADQLSAPAAGFAVMLDGRLGDDTLMGGNAADTLIGGAGADMLAGGAAADFLYGGTTVGGSDGAADTASYDDGRTSTVVSSLAGERQDGDFYSDIQNLTGAGGTDVLTGDAAANVISGGPGNDSITGGAGADSLRAGDGDDDIQARDGEVDAVECGPGTDLLDADDNDVRVDCEPRPVFVPTPAPQARCVVPNVKRRTVARARRLLRARRCTLGRVRRAYSARVRRGRIISQSRRPGARLPRGARVAVVVSRGRRR